jgi:Molybdenum cofactor biosynthesis enzyme
MPLGERTSCRRDQILSYEELELIARTAAGLGIQKIRVTGGEPTLRNGVVPFLGRLRAIPGIREVSMTTNGLHLASMAAELKAVGVNSVNVSLDSLVPEVFELMTRGGKLNRVLEGLEAAERAGLNIKLNVVVLRGINDGEIVSLAGLTLHRPWTVRFIEYMPTLRELDWQRRTVPGKTIMDRLNRRFKLVPVSADPLCGPARMYRIPTARGKVGIISPMSDHFCSDCNRIRVTATGRAKSCLLADEEADLRPYLGDRGRLQEALREVMTGKGRGHRFSADDDAGPAPFVMAAIGG